MAIYEIDVKNFDKLTKMLDSLNETFSSLKKVNKELDNVADADKGTKKMNKSLKDFNGQLTKINKNILGMFGIEEVEQHFKKISEFGKSLFSSLSAGGMGFLKTVGSIFLKFNAIMLIITAISAAVMFFKKAFQFNIGGIQGTFRKLQARFKQLGATLQVLFFNYLQKLAPVFEQIGKALESVMDVLMSPEVLSAFMAISEMFGNLLTLVLPPLLELVKVLAGWIKILAQLINKVVGMFKQGNSTVNNNTSNNTTNDNRIVNYYPSANTGVPDFLGAYNYTP